METLLETAIKDLTKTPTGQQFYQSFIEYAQPYTIVLQPEAEKQHVIRLSGHFIVQPDDKAPTVIYLSQAELTFGRNQPPYYNHDISVQTGPVVNFHYARGDTTHSLFINDMRRGSDFIEPFLRLATQLYALPQSP